MFRVAGLIALVALVGAAGYVATGEAKPDEVVATGQIILCRVDPHSNVPLPDYCSAPVAVLKSRDIAIRAAKDRELVTLKPFDGENGYLKILAALSVTREPDTTNVYNLSASGLDPVTGERMLDAVIRAYQQFLDERCKAGRDLVAEQLWTAGKAHEDRAEKLQHDLVEHRRYVHSNPSPVKYAEQLNTKLAQARVRQVELRAAIELVAKCRQDTELQQAMKDRITAWATRTGIPKDEATEERYLSALKLELKECETLAENLALNWEEGKSELVKAEAAAIREESLRRDIARVEKLAADARSKRDTISVEKTPIVELGVIYRPAPVKK